MAETRKIAAILVSDVVGYSRLAGVDEDHTLARLRVLRAELVEPTVAAHNGRIVKSTGDGSLVEFRSVVDAVRCAVAMQKAMLGRNAGVVRDRRIVFRIGIHVGEIVEESDGDLMGNGVNIAARLEGIAKPGAICLSEDAYRQVKMRLDVAVTDLGETHLKNIADPIRAYSLEIGKPAAAPWLRFARRRRPFAPPPWLVAASIALGAGVALYAAAPQPPAPVASVGSEPVASLAAAAPSASQAAKEPVVQTPAEPTYPAPPVRDPHKVARTAPSARTNRPSPASAPIGAGGPAAVAEARPQFYWPTPSDVEWAHKGGWVAPPPRPERRSKTPTVAANQTFAAVAEAPTQFSWPASPSDYEQAHKGGWVAPQ